MSEQEDVIEVSLENLQMLARQLLGYAKEALEHGHVLRRITICTKDNDAMTFGEMEEVPPEFREMEYWKEAYTNHIIDTYGGYAVFESKVGNFTDFSHMKEEDIPPIGSPEFNKEENKKTALILTLSISGRDYGYVQCFDLEDDKLVFGEYREEASHPKAKLQYSNLLDLDYIMSLD